MSHLFAMSRVFRVALFVVKRRALSAFKEGENYSLTIAKFLFSS